MRQAPVPVGIPARRHEDGRDERELETAHVNSATPSPLSQWLCGPYPEIDEAARTALFARGPPKPPRTSGGDTPALPPKGDDGGAGSRGHTPQLPAASLPGDAVAAPPAVPTRPERKPFAISGEMFKTDLFKRKPGGLGSSLLRMPSATALPKSRGAAEDAATPIIVATPSTADDQVDKDEAAR